MYANHLFHRSIRSSWSNHRAAKGNPIPCRTACECHSHPPHDTYLPKLNTPHPHSQVGMGKDHTLYALEPGYVKFYSSPIPYPHRAAPAITTTPAPASSSATTSLTIETPLSRLLKRPRSSRQYIGIVAEREEKLPRKEEERGRERRFWGAIKQTEEAESTLV